MEWGPIYQAEADAAVHHPAAVLHPHHQQQQQGEEAAAAPTAAAQQHQQLSSDTASFAHKYYSTAHTHLGKKMEHILGFLTFLKINSQLINSQLISTSQVSK